MKEKVNYGVIAEQLRKMKNKYKLYEDAENIATMIVEKDNVLSVIQSEERKIKSTIKRDAAVLEGLQTKIASARKEIDICNTETAGKVKKTKEELEYYKGELRGVNADLEGKKLEAQNLGDQVSHQRKELVVVGVEFEKKQKDCVDIESKTDKAKSNLKAIKDSLSV